MSPEDRLKHRIYYEIIVSDETLSPEILSIFHSNANFLQRSIGADTTLLYANVSVHLEHIQIRSIANLLFIFFKNSHQIHADKIDKFQPKADNCQQWQNHLTELAVMREATEL